METDATAPTPSETPPTTPTQTVLPGVSTPGTFAIPPATLARFLALAMARSGGKDPPFPIVDLAYEGSGNANPSCLRSEHRDKAGFYSATLSLALPPDPNGESFECVAGPATWLYDHLTSDLFADERPVLLRYEDDAGTPSIVVSDGSRQVRLAAASPSSVQRPVGPGNTPAFTAATELGLDVATDPSKTPKPATAPWPVWAESGYSVVLLPPTTVRQMLSVGASLLSHDLAGTEMVFDFTGDGAMTLSASDPKKRSESVVLAVFDATAVVGTPKDRVVLPFTVAQPFLASLGLLKAPYVAFVHRPGESRVTFAAAEMTESRDVTLRLSYSLMTKRDTTAKKAA